MKNYYALVLLLAIFGLSCQKDDISSLKQVTKPIVFKNLKVGQENRYVLLRGEDYQSNDNSDFEYTGDTMILSITKATPDGFLVEERLSSGSASLNGAYNVASPESTFYYYFQVNNKQLKMNPVNEREISRVLFLNDKTLSLEKSEELEVDIDGWKTSLPYTQQHIMAYTEEYDLLGATYNFLNVRIDNEKMTQNQPGYTHIYDPQVGLVRSSQYSPETSKGFGWDLLP